MHSKNLSVELDKSRSTATSLIIDGVDVSGCAYFWNKECRCTQDCIDYSGNNSTIKELFHKDTGIFADCENSPNCYYKQLKRKEQECEELTSKCSQLEEFTRKTKNIILKFAKGDILTFPDLSLEENCIAIQNQCLDPMRQIIQKIDEIQEENCHFDKIKELTKEM